MAAMTLRAYRIPLLVAMLALIEALLVCYVSGAAEAAARGVRIWWDILFPALFPFFVISELLLGFGIVHFFGTLLDPLMRPLFRVPGIGGFVMAMGFAAGYPVGARLTAKLWEEGLVDRDEGERLVSFTSTSDPVFLIGAVSVGFFHLPALAPLLAISHYGGGVVTGLLMRFHGRKPVAPGKADKRAGSLLGRAFANMHEARLLDGRPLGRLLREAVESSIRLVFVVGGLVVFFSVLLALLNDTGLMRQLHEAMAPVLRALGFPAQLGEAFMNGLFEVTLGAQTSAVAGTADIRLLDRAAVCAFVLSWSGWSVHAQIMSLLNHTGMRYRPFLIARVLHGIVSIAIVYALWPLFRL